MSSSIRRELEGFVAGRVQAERLVIAVSAAYYRDSRNGNRETLQPLIDVIDRASPGIVELGTAAGGPGFDIRLAERPFPKQYEAQLRRAGGGGLSWRGTRGGGLGHDSVAQQPPSPLPPLAAARRQPASRRPPLLPRAA